MEKENVLDLGMLQSENARLRRVVGGLKGTNTERSKKIAMLETKISDLQLELLDNRRMLDEMSAQVAEYHADNEALRAELSDCRSKKRSFWERLWG